MNAALQDFFAHRGDPIATARAAVRAAPQSAAAHLVEASLLLCSRDRRDFEAAGFGNLPVCMAKTQYSFSTDPSLLGAPSGHIVEVREVRLAAGAGFVVAICGNIMTMPGLPRAPAAERIHVDGQGRIEGLS